MTKGSNSTFVNKVCKFEIKNYTLKRTIYDIGLKWTPKWTSLYYCNALLSCKDKHVKGFFSIIFILIQLFCSQAPGVNHFSQNKNNNPTLKYTRYLIYWIQSIWSGLLMWHLSPVTQSKWFLSSNKAWLHFVIVTVVFFHFSTYVFINAFNLKRKRALKEEILSKIQNAQFCIKIKGWLYNPIDGIKPGCQQNLTM